MADKTRVALVRNATGPGSADSKTTAEACAAILESLGFETQVFEYDQTFVGLVGKFRPDVALNCTTSGSGRNGVLQGLLEHLRLPYTHSGILASALAMDKHQAKTVLMAAKLPVTAHTLADRSEAAAAHIIKPPYVIKPATESAAAGVFHVESGNTPPPPELLDEEWRGGDLIMIEQFIPGRDLFGVVLGDVALGVAENVPGGKDAPETDTGKDNEQIVRIPAQVSPKIYENIQKMSLKAHEALGCRGMTRVDFRFNDHFGGDGEIVCLGVNTQPPLFSGSVTVELARHAGQSPEELVRWIVENASCNR